MPTPDDIRNLESRAESSSKAGAYDEAATLYSKAGDEWSQKGEPFAENAAGAYAQSAQAHETASSQATKQGDKDKAAAEDQAALAAHAGAAESYQRAAEFDRRSHHWELAAKAFDAAGAQRVAIAASLELQGAQGNVDGDQWATLADANEKNSEKDKYSNAALAKYEDQQAAEYYQKAHDAHRKAEKAYHQAVAERQMAIDNITEASEMWDTLAQNSPKSAKAAQSASEKDDQLETTQRERININETQEASAKNSADREKRKATREKKK